MKVRRRSELWRRVARRLGRDLFRMAENNEDTRFASNGERWLLRELLRHAPRGNAPAPAMVIDAGANTGGYTREVLELARETDRIAEVHAFEPSAHCVEILRREFSAAPNVHIAPVALADRAGEAMLHDGRSGSSMASLVVRPTFATESSGELQVPLVRLDEYLVQHRIAHVDLLKLDVEGYELAALRGAGERLNPDVIEVIQFEYGGTTMDAGATLRDLFTLLESRGYRVGKLFPNAVELRVYAPWMEHYAYSNYVALAPRWFQPSGGAR
jgi:FkbM family methyltransferase